VCSARAWLDAAARPEVATELEAVYDYIAAAVESRGPRCWVSGRCCHFEASGHRLYVTGLEAAYTLRRSRAITAGDVRAARDTGGCPYQEDGRCGVHQVRPLGCRVYFCDHTAAEWQRELSERALRLVRDLHERHGIEYRYAEWRGLLGELLAAT
jgi:Fe-S-cluster containining protein